MNRFPLKFLLVLAMVKIQHWFEVKLIYLAFKIKLNFIKTKKVKMDKKRAFIAFFWAAGMIYTGHNLIENCIRYKQYNSMTINKYDKNGDYNTYTV